MFEKLQAALAKMNDEAPRPNLPPLNLSEPYDFSSDWPDKSWYGATHPGVYIFAGEEGELLYIGKASCGRNIGNRLSAYWRHSPEKKPEPKTDEAVGVRFVLTITVPTGHAYEVPAIEEWLIRELKPLRNKTGV